VALLNQTADQLGWVPRPPGLGQFVVVLQQYGDQPSTSTTISCTEISILAGLTLIWSNRSVGGPILATLATSVVS
jgi:hypothetical protein